MEQSKIIDTLETYQLAAPVCVDGVEMRASMKASAIAYWAGGVDTGGGTVEVASGVE